MISSNPFKWYSSRGKAQPTSPKASTNPPVSVEPGPKDSDDVVTGEPEAAAEPGPAAAKRPLDIVFLQDSTGSQGQYISSARKAIQSICEKVSLSPALAQGPSPNPPNSPSGSTSSSASIRFGLVAFRDHPPQDMSFVTKNFGFTSNVAEMAGWLGGLVASGGGDGPEASTAALADALNMQWKENSVKIVVLITDAPPHGIGEDGDGFRDGSPDQNDPLELARQMAEHGITLYVIACEPTLSRYRNAVDFYRALTEITSGRMVPLINANQLGDYIIASAIETLETEHLIGQFEKVILEDVYGQGKSVEEVAESIQAELNRKKVQLSAVNVEDVYMSSETATKNQAVWKNAGSLRGARGRVEAVEGPRIKSSYLSSTRNAGERCDFKGMGALRGWSEGGSSSAKPSARPLPRAAPAAPTMYSQAVDKTQATRMVMQGLMRSAKVGAGGILTPTGAYAGKASVDTSSATASGDKSGST